MNSIPWILISVAVLIVILAIAAVLLKNKYKSPPDYYAFFWIGLIWVLFGLFTVFNKDYSLSGLGIMGVVFFIIGLANKDKWKQNRRSWDQLTPAERKFKTWLIVVLSLLVVLGAAAMLVVNQI